MKTFNNLYPSIISFENILHAYQKAAKGKREKSYVMRFTQNLEENLIRLQNELINKTYQPGQYKAFYIYAAKERKISAAPFRDRVIHHALINVIGPLIEKTFIDDSYANRKGKGVHAAIDRYQFYLQKYHYVLKTDISKYFPSIDHMILKQLVRKKIKDKTTLWLIDNIIDGSNPQIPVSVFFPGDDLLTMLERRKGLPLGNLTSQFFANWYLNPLDHFVKEELQCKAYIRYVDDFALFADDKRKLRYWQTCIEGFLQRYRLLLNPKSTRLYPVVHMAPFLGQLVGCRFRRIKGENVRSFRSKRKKWFRLTEGEIKQKLSGWYGHVKQAGAYRLYENEISNISDLWNI